MRGMNVDPQKPGDLKYLKLYGKYLLPHYKTLALGFVLIPLISVVHIIQPILIKRGIDENIANSDLEGLSFTASMFGVCVLLELIFRSSQTYLFQMIGIKSISVLRNDLFSHIQNQSTSYFDKTPSGKLVTRVTSDIEALNESFSSGVVTLIADILTIIGILGCMFYLSPKLTIVTLLSIPPLFLVVNYFKKRLRLYYSRVRTSVAKLNSYLQEQLEGYQIVQLFQREERNYKGFKKENSEYKKANMGSIVNDSLLYSTMEGFSSIVIILMIYFGSLELASGAITLGLLVAFIEYIRKFFQPLKELSSKFAILQSALAALEKIFSAFSDNTAIESGNLALNQTDYSIKFKDVSFSYPGHEDKIVLSNINFELKPSQTLAIVGPTGSGKSTISKLVSHLYSNYEGQILFGDIELKELDLNHLRKAISVVTQDVELFNESILFNITLGNPDISEERAIEASKLAQADDFITSYQDNPTRGLSSGQAQLISIARALASPAPFVIFDEATASVDSINEQKLQKAIENVLKQKSVLVIAHRLSTIKQADKILVLKDGKIIESGTHKELIEKDAYYATLYKMQFSNSE